MKLKIFFTIIAALSFVSVYDILEISAIQYPDENCIDCIENESNQILTIFNFETEENPFLAKKSTFLITPNPFMHNLDADSINPQKFGVNLIITDNDSLDSDPMLGVIEMIGVNPGMYSIIELKGPPGLIKTSETFSSDEIFGETYSHVHVTNFVIDSSSITTINLDSPDFGESILQLLQTYHATIGGVALTLADQMPSAKLANNNNLFSGNAPKHIKFGTAANGLWNTQERFTNLGIPTYHGTSYTTSNSQLTFIPPLFVTENTDDTNFVISPIMEQLSPGTNLLLRLDQTDTKTSSGSAITGLSIPLSTYGEDVGISLQLYDKPPANFPSFNPALSGSSIFLDFSSVGNIDFSDSGSFSGLARMYFVLPSIGLTCPDGVKVFLRNEPTNTWEPVTSSPARNPSGDSPQGCGYVQNLSHFSSYVVGTGFTGGTSGGSTGGGGSGGSSGGSSGSGHDHGSHSHGGADSGSGSSSSSTGIGTDNSVVGAGSITQDGLVGSPQGEKTLEFGGILKDDQLEFGRPVEQNVLKFGEKLYDESADFNPKVIFATLTELGNFAPDYGYNFGSSFSGTRLIVDIYDKTFPIKYIFNGQIKKVVIYQEAKSISFGLENVLESELTLRLPRTLIDAENDKFIVAVSASPEQLVDYSVAESDREFVTLRFNVPDYAQQITITGTNIVPEFGVFVIFVLVVSISTIILVRGNFTIVRKL